MPFSGDNDPPGSCRSFVIKSWLFMATLVLAIKITWELVSCSFSSPRNISGIHLWQKKHTRARIRFFNQNNLPSVRAFYRFQSISMYIISQWTCPWELVRYVCPGQERGRRRVNPGCRAVAWDFEAISSPLDARRMCLDWAVIRRRTTSSAFWCFSQSC